MKKYLFLFGLILLPLFSDASHSPEVLILDQETPDRFLLSNSLQETTIDVRNDREEGKVELQCSSDVRVKTGPFTTQQGKELNFTLGKDKKISLTLPRELEKCILKTHDKLIELIKDELAFPFLKNLNRKIESCNYLTQNQSPLEQLFLSNNYPMMTCAHSSEEIEILPDPHDGLLSKMEVLLGYKPNSDFIRKGNPYAELDFSQAPKLDAIFVSTLLYRRDFTGTVVGRLLRFHAERGTLVYIIGTGYMQDEKDKGLLKELSFVKNGNIRIQEYKYLDKNPGIKTPGAYLTNYLRDMHVKMFVTLSSNPSDNTVITGGRNIHDGFVFDQKPDFSKYPELQQSPEGAWAFWNDLESKSSRPSGESRLRP